jgi:hypothetical protein
MMKKMSWQADKGGIYSRRNLREEDGVGAPDAALASRDERDTVPQFSRTDTANFLQKRRFSRLTAFFRRLPC